MHKSVIRYPWWGALQVLVVAVLAAGASRASAQGTQPAEPQTAAQSQAVTQEPSQATEAPSAETAVEPSSAAPATQPVPAPAPATEPAVPQPAQTLAPAPAIAAPAPQPAVPGEQSPRGRLIKAVEIEGLQRVPEAFVRARLRTRAGSTYDEAEVRSDLRRLIEANRFTGVDATYRIDKDGQVTVIFRVQEKPLLTAVEFEGNTHVSTKDLLAATGLTAGKPTDVFTLRQALDRIEQKYHESGYYYAKATLDEEKLQTQGIALFHVAEGPRVKVRKIVFEGNKSFPASRLAGTLETKTYIWIFRTGAYDPDVIARDEANIANFYREQGYLDARVSHRLEFAPNREDLTLVFLIDEGNQYFVKQLVFEGNTVMSDPELLGLMRMQVGSPLLQEYVKADIRAIKDAYGQIGYIYADVTATPTFLPEPARVRLTINIKEGPRIHVGEVLVRGNERTQDRVIRRQVTLIPGEVYDSTRQDKIKTRLLETQLFEDAEVSPAGGEDDVRNVLVRVSEANTTQFIVGAGVTSNNGLLGNITLENRNFDITRWPRSFGDFFHGQAFRGAGQLFRLQLEPGTELMRFRLSWREPYLFDKPISLGTGAYIFERGRDGYTEQRGGGTFSLGKRLQSGVLKDWSVEGAGRWEYVNITDANEWYTAQDIRDVRGGSYLSTVKLSLLRDRTDSAVVPDDRRPPPDVGGAGRRFRRQIWFHESGSRL